MRCAGKENLLGLLHEYSLGWVSFDYVPPGLYEEKPMYISHIKHTMVPLSNDEWMSITSFRASVTQNYADENIIIDKWGFSNCYYCIAISKRTDSFNHTHPKH